MAKYLSNFSTNCHKNGNVNFDHLCIHHYMAGQDEQPHYQLGQGDNPNTKHHDIFQYTN